MIALLSTRDPVKLSAVTHVLSRAGVRFQVFDAAVGDLLSAVVPVRVMIADDALQAARTALWSAGFTEARDGDWDFV